MSRLSPPLRRSFAISRFAALGHDASRSVRLGTLEILGEVIYTFHDDPFGPPDELIALFIGNTKAIGPLIATTTRPPLNHSRTVSPRSHHLETTGSDDFRGAVENTTGEDSSDAEPDYDEDFDETKGQFERGLISAFSFPAVALTLGCARWNELRAFYIALAAIDQESGSNSKVRKTLAASVGEMAKIVGSEAALNDLLPLLYDVLRTPVGPRTGPCMMDKAREEEEIKIKAIECLETFIEAIDERRRGEIGRELERIWMEDLTGWREREAFAKKLGGLSRLLRRYGNVVRGLVMKALVDPVAVVRESAVDQVSIVVDVMFSLCSVSGFT